MWLRPFSRLHATVFRVDSDLWELAEVTKGLEWVSAIGLESFRKCLKKREESEVFEVYAGKTSFALVEVPPVKKAEDLFLCWTIWRRGRGVPATRGRF